VSLAAALERAAEALPDEADRIRPANGDPERLLAGLPPASAARVLAWLLASEPEAADELIDSWLEWERGPEVVLAIEEAPLPKPGRKVLRRARHQLKSQGVRVEEAPPAPTVAHLPPVADELTAAAVTAPDPLGACLAYLVEGHPSGGARLFEIAFAEGRGILSVEVYSAGRSKVRAFLREVTGRRGLAAVEASPEVVRALVRRAAAAQPEDRPFPAGWREWQGQLGDVSPDAPTPGDLARASLGEPSEPLELEPALALVREGRVGPWPAREVLERIAKRIQETSESTLIVAGPRRREQVDALLREGAEEAFGGAGGARVAALFRHAAFVFQVRDDEAAARACIAAAAAFAGRPPAENPLALALFERPLAPFLERLAQQEREDAEKSSLIVKPGPR
jgi:hypothetical protein